MCPSKETMNLNFVENLVGLRIYPSMVKYGESSGSQFFKYSESSGSKA